MEAFHAWARHDYVGSAYMGREASPFCNDKPKWGNTDEKHESKIKRTSRFGFSHQFAVSRINFAGFTHLSISVILLKKVKKNKKN